MQKLYLMQNQFIYSLMSQELHHLYISQSDDTYCRKYLLLNVSNACAGFCDNDLQ